MARTTKAALEQQLAELNAVYEQAHAALMHVSAQRDALETELASTIEHNTVLQNMLIEQQSLLAQASGLVEHLSRPAPAKPAPRTQYVAPSWQAERAASMAQAKALAMRIGRSVRVQ